MEKDFKYQQELNLCVGRMKEVLKGAHVERLNDLNIVISENNNDEMEYDSKEHTLHIPDEAMNKATDKANFLMHGLLDVITTDRENNKRGISLDGKMDAFNIGINHQLANTLIPCGDTNLKQFECSVIADLFTNIASLDVVYNAYLNSDGEKVYSKLEEQFNNDKIYTDTILSFCNIEINSFAERGYPSLLGYIQTSVSEKYIKSNNLTIDEMKKFRDEAMFTDVGLLPNNSSIKLRLYSCEYSDSFIKQEIERSNNLSNRMNNNLANKMNDDLDLIFKNQDMNITKPKTM